MVWNYLGFLLSLWLVAWPAAAAELQLGDLSLRYGPPWERAPAQEEAVENSVILRWKGNGPGMTVFLPRHQVDLKVEEKRFYRQLEQSWRAQYGADARIYPLHLAGTSWRACRRPSLDGESTVFQLVNVYQGRAHHLLVIAAGRMETLPDSAEHLAASASWGGVRSVVLTRQHQEDLLLDYPNPLPPAPPTSAVSDPPAASATATPEVPVAAAALVMPEARQGETVPVPAATKMAEVPPAAAGPGQADVPVVATAVVEPEASRGAGPFPEPVGAAEAPAIPKEAGRPEVPAAATALHKPMEPEPPAAESSPVQVVGNAVESLAVASEPRPPLAEPGHRWHLARVIHVLPKGKRLTALAEEERARLGENGMLTGYGMSLAGKGYKGFLEGYAWEGEDARQLQRKPFARQWQLAWRPPEEIGPGEQAWGLQVTESGETPGQAMRLRLELLPICGQRDVVLAGFDALVKATENAGERLVALSEACHLPVGDPPVNVTSLPTGSEERSAALGLPAEWTRATGVREGDVKRLVVVASHPPAESSPQPGDALLAGVRSYFIYKP